VSAKGRFERTVIRGHIAKRKIDSELKRRRFRYVVEQGRGVAMNVLIRRPAQWRVSRELTHDRVFTCDAFHNSQHVMVAEYALICEHAGKRQRDVVSVCTVSKSGRIRGCSQRHFISVPTTGRMRPFAATPERFASLPIVIAVSFIRLPGIFS